MILLKFLYPLFVSLSLADCRDRSSKITFGGMFWKDQTYKE
jgi:hypothetical protein